MRSAEADSLERKPYETPKVYVLDTLEKMTQEVEKAAGSGDAFMPFRTC